MGYIYTYIYIYGVYIFMEYISQSNNQIITKHCGWYMALSESGDFFPSSYWYLKEGKWWSGLPLDFGFFPYFETKPCCQRSCVWIEAPMDFLPWRLGSCATVQNLFEGNCTGTLINNILWQKTRMVSCTVNLPEKAWWCKNAYGP